MEVTKTIRLEDGTEREVTGEYVVEAYGSVYVFDNLTGDNAEDAFRAFQGEAATEYEGAVVVE